MALGWHAPRHMSPRCLSAVNVRCTTQSPQHRWHCHTGYRQLFSLRAKLLLAEHFPSITKAAAACVQDPGCPAACTCKAYSTVQYVLHFATTPVGLHPHGASRIQRGGRNASEGRTAQPTSHTSMSMLVAKGPCSSQPGGCCLCRMAQAQRPRRHQYHSH